MADDYSSLGKDVTDEYAALAKPVESKPFVPTKHDPTQGSYRAHPELEPSPAAATAKGLGTQLLGGLSGGLVGTAARSAERALPESLGGGDTFTAPAPQDAPEAAYRLAGMVPATILDAASLNKAGAAADIGAMGKYGKFIMDAIKGGAKAAPIRTGVATGGLLGTAGSEAQEYADTGEVTPEHTIIGGLLGLGLGGAIPAAINPRQTVQSVKDAAGAINPVARSAYRTLTGAAPSSGALKPQAEGQILAETTPKAREQVAAATSTQEGQQALANVAGKRVQGAQDALVGPTGTEEPTQAVAGAVQGARQAEVGNATQAATDAAAAAEKARAGSGLSTSTDAEVEGRGIQQAVKDFETAQGKRREEMTAPERKKAEGIAARKEAAGELADGSSIRSLLESQPEAGQLPITEGKRTANTLTEWLFGPEPSGAVVPAIPPKRGAIQGGGMTADGRPLGGQAAPQITGGSINAGGQPIASEVVPSMIPGRPSQSVISGGGLGKSGQPLPAPGPNNQTTFDKLRAADTTVRQAASSALDPSRKAFYVALRDKIHEAMDQQTNGVWSSYRGQYQQHSAPVNYLQGGADTIGAKAGESRDFVSQNVPEAEQPFDPFKANPEKMGDGFVKQGARGADKLRLVFDDPKKAGSGQAGLDQFAQNYFARQMEGKDAQGVAKLLADNGTFLSRTPKTAAALNDVATKLRDAEQVRSEAADIIKYQVDHGILTSTDPLTAKNGVYGLLDKGDPEALRTVAVAMKASRPNDAAKIGRDAVASYFGDKMQPLTDSARTQQLPPGTVASRIDSVANDWASKRQALIDSGFLSRGHAADVDKVMADLKSLTGAISGLPGAGGTELAGKGAAELAAHVAGPKGTLAMKVLPDSWYRDKVQAAVQQAMFNPEAAAKLAQRFQSAKTPAQKIKALGTVQVYAQSALNQDRNRDRNQP